MAHDSDPAPAKAVVVLLVEDEFLVRAIMADILVDAGFEVIEASHAAEAIQIMQQGAAEVSLLFTDVHMPGKMDGLDLVQHVHTHWPKTRLLVASGKARLEAGSLPPGCEFLPKPYDVAATVDRVRQLACG